MRYFTVNGIFKRFNSEPRSTVGLKDFNRIFKDLLDLFKVANTNECCPMDTTNLPVRYNKDLARLEYFDDATKTFIIVP